MHDQTDDKPLSTSLSHEAMTISILQTTDVHCQIHPHDELFWEDEQAVFRKTGGYAYLSAMLHTLKKKIR